MILSASPHDLWQVWPTQHRIEFAFPVSGSSGIWDVQRTLHRTLMRISCILPGVCRPAAPCMLSMMRQGLGRVMLRCVHHCIRKLHSQVSNSSHPPRESDTACIGATAMLARVIHAVHELFMQCTPDAAIELWQHTLRDVVLCLPEFVGLRVGSSTTLRRVDAVLAGMQESERWRRSDLWPDWDALPPLFVLRVGWLDAQIRVGSALVLSLLGFERDL